MEETAESDYENSWFIFMFIVALSGKNCGRRIKQTTRYSIRRRIFAKQSLLFISVTHFLIPRIVIPFVKAWYSRKTIKLMNPQKHIFNFFFKVSLELWLMSSWNFSFPHIRKNWKAKRLRKAIMDRQINNNTMDGISRNTSRVLAPPGGRS